MVEEALNDGCPMSIPKDADGDAMRRVVADRADLTRPCGSTFRSIVLIWQLACADCLPPAGFTAAEINDPKNS
jgi:hypothetical protein